MIASTLDTLLGAGGVVGILFLFVCAVLGIAAVLMPLVVIMIHSRLDKCYRTLAAMEDMMRNGK